MNNKALAVVALIVGILLLVAGIMYATMTANNLPSFFPGHETAATQDKHMKHAIAAIVVAICCFIFGWFVSGNKSTSGSKG